jgi:cytochrome c
MPCDIAIARERGRKCSSSSRGCGRCVTLIVSVLALAGCSRESEPVLRVAGGDAERGRVVLDQYQCGVCHVIPGVPAAVGRVGPALDHYAQRPYLAGKFPNEPERLVSWILDAPAMAPQTAMPAIAMSQQDARDAAAYLYTSD